MRVRRTSAVDHRKAILAAIARREWLLRMLALGAARCASDRRPHEEPTLTVARRAVSGTETDIENDLAAHRELGILRGR